MKRRCDVSVKRVECARILVIESEVGSVKTLLVLRPSVY